ncbi:hypothetical protein H5410_025771 [Solanum commersonii]|uniref:Uncharacterized protein n=1 Tax=Solanum commersonii TaxID=4109 RepID=A0A9J5YWZ3_SOLCO|nr:hypothetical protein H5410_025771 [Solanum commersonii]
MNGLVNDMRFLLKYTMGGLTLQVSDHVSCFGYVVYHAYCDAYFQSRLDNELQNGITKIGENAVH